MNTRVEPESGEEQEWRAAIYLLLATLLREAPATETLQRLAAISLPEPAPEPTVLDSTWIDLIRHAADTEVTAVRVEFNTLFIGMTRGELMPYASWYLTGFLMEKPLAAIRGDLAALAIERTERTREPEDHIAALFETMVLLIREHNPAQRRFFNDHIAPWARRFFNDLAYSRSADFYRSVGQFGLAFVDLELQQSPDPGSTWQAVETDATNR